MSKRYEYTLLLPDFASSTASRIDDARELRPAREADVSAIADLMLDAYRGTIDDDGEPSRMHLPRFRHTWRVSEGDNPG